MSSASLPTPWIEQAKASEQLTSIDGMAILTRLLLCFQALCGQTSGVVERLRQEMVDASQGQVSLLLLQRHTAQEMAFPSSMLYRAPIHQAGRLYGWLLIVPDPTQPEQAALSFSMSRNVAQCCALFFYTLCSPAQVRGTLQSRPTRSPPGYTMETSRT